VKAVHDRDFDRAEALCNKGLKIAQGDKAFTDLLNQIPQWRKDTLQAQVTAQYAKAVQLVHEGKLNAGERACKKGLELEPGNASFAELLRDIDSRRNVNLQTYLLDCYQEAATLMNNGKLRAAASKCHEGLKRQPHDEQLVSLLKLIRARENGDDSR
jgi:predicted Zn-dependent protease